MRSRTARVMTTLMRNGRDRRSENPLWADAILERVFLVGTDQRITSGPAATAAASQRDKPRRENRPDTWLHPNASQKSQIPLATRAPSIHGPKRRAASGWLSIAFGAKRKWLLSSLHAPLPAALDRRRAQRRVLHREGRLQAGACVFLF